MEPIIRNAVVAPETRQIRRPRTEQAETGTSPSGNETAFANRGRLAGFGEEKKSYQEQAKPAVPSDPQPLDAEKELEKCLAGEKALADAQALAEKRGYAAGLEKGEEEARKAVMEHAERLSSVIAALYRAKADVIESGEDEIVEIVYTAVCRIIGEAAVTPEAVSDAVKRVVALARDRDQLTVRLHPEDFELVQKLLSQAGSAIAEKPVTLFPDAAIELGGCIVEGAIGSLDARLEVQVERLREALIEARRNRERNKETV